MILEESSELEEQATAEETYHIAEESEQEALSEEVEEPTPEILADAEELYKIVCEPYGDDGEDETLVHGDYFQGN
jgi:hypothetical protein